MLNRPNDLGPIHFSGSLSRYYLYVAFLLLGIFVFVVLGWTRFGRRLVAMRENEDLARSVGISLVKMRLEVLALGGALAGVAGVLYAYQEPAISPSLFDALAFLPVVAMVIIGGRAISLGPLLGAFLLEMLPSWLNFSPLVSQLFYGAFVILIILLLPEGVASIFVGTGNLARRLVGRHKPAEPNVSVNSESVAHGTHPPKAPTGMTAQKEGGVK
jgi:branched-chain amino acid transport system permease protein